MAFAYCLAYASLTYILAVAETRLDDSIGDKQLQTEQYRLMRRDVTIKKKEKAAVDCLTVAHLAVTQFRNLEKLLVKAI